MVSKVYARAPDLELVFYHVDVDGDRWETSCPRDLKGQYYLDLYAEDQAGNVTFMATALFEVDPFSLCSRITLLEDDQCFKVSQSDIDFVCKEVRCL